MTFVKEISFILILFVLLFMSASWASAADEAWSVCPNKAEIARCETINCPQGDTNSDGKCTLADANAELTDARNDALCANPTSGCGQVNYFEKGQAQACSTRTKESNFNCSLYSVSELKPTTKPSPTPTATPVAKPQTKKILPETGPSGMINLSLAVLGLAGFATFLRFRHA